MSGKEEILARCIDEVLSGRSTVEQVLERYPELSEELRPLIEIALSVKPPEVSATPEFRQRARARLIEAMGPAPVREPFKIKFWSVPAISVRAVAIIVIAFVVIASGTTSVYAAQSSLPGDTLYPVKIGVEKVQVAVTVDPESKAYLHLEFAQRRVDEVAEQVGRNQTADVSGLANLSEQTDAALREIEKTDENDAGVFLSKLAESSINQQVTLGALITSSTEEDRDEIQQAMSAVQRTNLVAQAAYSNSAFLHTKPSVRDEKLERGRFNVDGTLISVNATNWNVGGLVLTNVKYSGEIPPVNSQVEIEAIKKDNTVFIIKLERETSSQGGVNIKGTFKGTDSSGKTWYVGEMPIDAPQNEQTPSEGDRLALQGETRDGSLAITNVRKEDSDDDDDDEAKIEGKLISVDNTNKILTVYTAGARISINISGARIYSDEGKELEFSDLSYLINKDIKASGLVKKEGAIYAKEVRIEVERHNDERSDD